jgi:hypothetical protein
MADCGGVGGGFGGMDEGVKLLVKGNHDSFPGHDSTSLSFAKGGVDGFGANDELNCVLSFVLCHS